jgi:hypothetical protein
MKTRFLKAKQPELTCLIKNKQFSCFRCSSAFNNNPNHPGLTDGHKRRKFGILFILTGLLIAYLRDSPLKSLKQPIFSFEPLRILPKVRRQLKGAPRPVSGLIN